MLGIEIEDQDAAMLFAECGCEVDAGGGLATAAFLVGYRDGPHVSGMKNRAGTVALKIRTTNR